MSFKTDSFIKYLRQAVPILELCRLYNIELQPEGKLLYGYCPFHEDNVYSFVVNPSKNSWKCLRACSNAGDNIRFVMKIEKISFQSAVRKLLFLQSSFRYEPHYKYGRAFESHHD